MVSCDNQTPIRAALARGHERAVLALLENCTSEEYWKSNESIFEAARMGNSRVLQTILDAGVAEDGVDIDLESSPLHSVGLYASVSCVEILKLRYDIEQRRKKDHRTRYSQRRQQSTVHGVVRAMLPKRTCSVFDEAKRLWRFASEPANNSITENALFDTVGAFWFENLFHTLDKAGVTEVLHKVRGESPLVSFIQTAGLYVPRMIQLLQQKKPHRYFRNWKPFSETVS